MFMRFHAELIAFGILLVLCLLAPHAAGQGIDWMQVRGSDNPGARYSSFVETPSGRWLAAGSGGQLMYSDDEGTSWNYEVILDQDDDPVFGTITDLAVHGGQVLAVAISLVPSSNRFGLPFEGRTRILTSSNNGASWQIENFPIAEAIFEGQTFPGILLPNLFVTSGGEVLAYGATALSNGARIYYIGGAIFRRLGPGSWQQVFFENGMLVSMAQGGGRFVASGFQSVLDSPDGIAWNGYPLRNGNFQVDGELLPFDVLRSLYASDVAFVDSRYVMQTQALEPDPVIPGVFQLSAERAFVFESLNPFDGGRFWTGSEQNRIYPNWLEVGDDLVSLFFGAYRSGDGTSWSEVDPTVQVPTNSYGSIGGQGIVAIGSSEAAWRSNDAGQSWTKILDAPIPPRLEVVVRLDGALYAIRRSFSADAIWVSYDNGVNWSELADVDAQTGSGIGRLIARDGDLYVTQGNDSQISRSTDGGLTWTVLTLPGDGGDTVADIVAGDNGRLIVAPESGSVTSESPVYLSDDGGLTWSTRQAPLAFGETPKDGLHVGNGRIVYLLNGFASFDPRLLASDDNGETWQIEAPFQDAVGLNQVSGGTERVIDLRRIVQLDSGRLVVLGKQGELVTSDDLGLTWTVRLNYDGPLGTGEGFLDWSVYDSAEVGDRIIVPASRRAQRFGSTNIYFAFVSDDGGDTFREVSIPVSFPLDSAVAGFDDRVILSGSNGNVFVANLAVEPATGPEGFAVRESETLTIGVPRPPGDGTLTVSFDTQPLEAEEGVDYQAVSGELTWAAAETGTKPLVLTTFDDAAFEQPERFLVDLALEGDLVVSFSYLVTIGDNEGGASPGIEVIGAEALATSETGESANFRVALLRQPTATVTIDVVQEAGSIGISSRGEASELLVSPTTLTFLPEDWNEPQTVTVTGQDDPDPDQDRTVRLRLTATSDDTAYADLLSVAVYVTNVDDEPDPSEIFIFSDGFEAN